MCLEFDALLFFHSQFHTLVSLLLYDTPHLTTSHYDHTPSPARTSDQYVHVCVYMCPCMCVGGGGGRRGRGREGGKRESGRERGRRKRERGGKEEKGGEGRGDDE